MANRTKVSAELLPERPRASTPEGRDAMMTAYAYDLVERRLREGTASSQETTFFLKLGTMREKLELEKLKKENALLAVKANAIESEAEKTKMYREAVEAIQRYSAWMNDGD